MNGIFLFLLVLEIWAAGFVIWGFAHEDKFIAFEQRIGERIKRAVKK